MGQEEKKKEHADIEPTEEFAERTKEAESKLAPAMGKRKKPKVGPATGSSPKGTVTVGTVRTYTKKEAAREAIADDEKKKEEEKSAKANVPPSVRPQAKRMDNLAEKKEKEKSD